MSIYSECSYVDTCNMLTLRVSGEQIRLQFPPKLFGVNSGIGHNNDGINNFTCCKYVAVRLDIRATYGAVGGVTVDGVYEFVDVEVVSVIDSWTVHHLNVTSPHATAVTVCLRSAHLYRHWSRPRRCTYT